MQCNIFSCLRVLRASISQSSIYRLILSLMPFMSMHLIAIVSLVCSLTPLYTIELQPLPIRSLGLQEQFLTLTVLGLSGECVLHVRFEPKGSLLLNQLMAQREQIFGIINLTIFPNQSFCNQNLKQKSINIFATLSMIKNKEKSWKEGVVQFKSNPSQISSILVTMGGKMNSKVWQLSQNRYNDWQLKQQFLKQNIEILKVQGLRIKRSQTPTIIKQISSAKFPQLIQLNLQGNHITSIEALLLVEMRNLRQISLGSNFITSIRPLRKTNFCQIEDINLKKNLIQQITDQFTYLQALMLRSVELQTFPSDKAQGQFLDWTFKVHSPFFQWIFIVSQRIKKQKFENKFRKLYPFCTVKNNGRQN